MNSSIIIGNGINQAFSSNVVTIDNMLDEYDKEKETVVPKDHSIPFPLKVILRTNDHVDDLMKQKSKDFFGKVSLGSEECDFYKRLLSLPSTDIMTTNYGFELEETALNQPELNKKCFDAMRSTICRSGRAEGKYFLQTYNSVSLDDSEKRIWHIHGNAKNPSSMVIGHYYYGRLLKKVITYVEENEYRYLVSDNNPSVKSWIDAFLFGDVYILGFGCDFSEMDIWWLINCKKNQNMHKNNKCGQIYFYEPMKREDEVKHALLRCYGVKIENFGVEICRNDSKIKRNKKYKEFYYRAIEDIEKKMR